MFIDFKQAVTKQFQQMKSMPLFIVDVDKDLLWETYLGSFPEGTNPIFRERAEYDCQQCKQFIRAVGNIVAIDCGKLSSIWDVVGIENTYYQPVADALSKLIKEAAIKNIFLHYEKKAGTDFNIQLLENGDTLKWEHFYLELPDQVVVPKAAIGPKWAEVRSTKEVFQRGLEEITVDALETVLELIAQNSLYRGQENRNVVEVFLKHKKDYDKLKGREKEFFVWSTASLTTRIRNTAIGTLLVDLSEGKELDYAVASYESKVAPTNYKRPTALITPMMIKKAEEKVAELGFETALARRYATIDDITINNILFADRVAKKAMNVFDELAADVMTKFKSLEKVEKVSIDDFIANILPRAESIEIGVENRHESNFMSLIAPCDPESKNMLKWGNNFTWGYKGDVTDSIKERVKAAGGNVTGDLRCSLSWYNRDDLDIHMVEPNNEHIHYGHKLSRTGGGNLDVDMNAGGHYSRTPVENITYPNKREMQEGSYKLSVTNFNKRETINVGFEVEIEFAGVIHKFVYEKDVRDGRSIIVAEFDFNRKTGITFTKTLPETSASKEIWGVKTQDFRKVSMVMNSPNHWDGEETGNKHYFFIVEGCLQDGEARGFFNEFLIPKLNEHRKVFEVLGSKMKTAKSDQQLSGLGFSSTQRNSVFCNVTGSFARKIEITF